MNNDVTFSVTDRSNNKVLVNLRYVRHVETERSGLTIIHLVDGDQLAVKETVAQIETLILLRQNQLTRS